MIENIEPDFTSATMRWLAEANLNERQSLGQFMTPRFMRMHLLEQLEIKAGDKVLDPGVGTGEFLRDAWHIQPEAQYFGWDIDPKILEFAHENIPVASLENVSALESTLRAEFDFIIGNPPYFELKLEPEMKSRYAPVISGRANIYAMFIKLGIELLKPGGTLAYVVPPSMNAGAYFKNLRNYIQSNGHVSYLKIFHKSDHFVDAQTSVQVIVIKKALGRSNHVYIHPTTPGQESLAIYVEDKGVLESAFQGKLTLLDLGYKAVTGTIVWNQKKDLLRDETSEEAVPLYYARNIRSGQIELIPDDLKKQFIVPSKPQLGPAILINRIIGGVGKGLINAALVPEGQAFVAENHLNVIQQLDSVEQKVSFNNLLAQVRSRNTIEAARLITGNTQLSASEWNSLIPFTL